MKKPIKFTVLFLLAGLLAACNPTPSDSVTPSEVDSETPTSVETSTSVSEEVSEEVPLTPEEFELAANHIALTVPLAVEKTTGATIHTNVFRAMHNIATTPVLKDGNAIGLTTSGTLVYEDEENDVWLYPSYTIAWSYLENEAYGTFEFETDRNGDYLANPGYPTYLPEYDGGGNPVHTVPAAKAARLYATVFIGEAYKRFNIDVILEPQALINFVSLLDVREATAGDLVGVRGFVHGIFTDWNTAGIGDGKWGLGLYRLDSGFINSMEVGELVEVVGQVSMFNGLAQLQWIKSVKVLDPADWPEIKRPEVQLVTHDDLADQLERGAGDLTGPLQDKDNALVKFDKPFTFKRVVNRENQDVGFAGFNVAGNDHTNVIMEGETSDGEKFEVKLSINYHMKEANQIAFRDFLQANQDKPIYYTGPLSWYNELVLGPYEFAGSLSLTAE